MCCVVRGQQRCCRDDPRIRSLWRSADLDHQTTLVSQSNTKTRLLFDPILVHVFFYNSVLYVVDLNEPQNNDSEPVGS